MTENGKRIAALVASQDGLVSTRDVEAMGVSRKALYRMLRKGMVIRVGHGLYSMPELPATEYLPLLEVTKRVPKAVICLVSALSFHGITTQIPHAVWITVERGSWRPSIQYPPLNVTHVSGDAFSYGMQVHNLSGVGVRIYSPAKTVADCFKFRNKVGLDVAIEAMKETWRSRKASVDEIMEAASVCRVSRIVRPYLEAIV